MIKKNIIYTFTFLLFLSACTKEKDNIQYSMDNIKNVPQAKWDKLASKKIYFGHQSVGYNMVDGMEVVLKENTNIKLNINKGRESNLFRKPAFAHDNNGSNRDPRLKIDDFYTTLNHIGQEVDFAGFKFCYVDVEKGTNINELFSYYTKKMNEVALKYPDLTLIHYTVPLKSLQTGLKAFIKKILGKDIGIDDNSVRNEFNNLLRKEYKNQIIFDLAKFESSYPDGKRSFSEVNGKKIYTMAPIYTSDGGHLSKIGKKKIGEDYLCFLAEISSKKE